MDPFLERREKQEINIGLRTVRVTSSPAVRGNNQVFSTQEAVKKGIPIYNGEFEAFSKGLYIVMVSYIWRDAVTSPPDSSNNSSFKATDYISFELATGTDDNGHIHQSEFKITTALADNEKPNAKLNELQDTQVRFYNSSNYRFIRK